MAGMDVSDDGLQGHSGWSYLEGGMGGEASQLDGRGGRGGRAPYAAELFKALGLESRPHMKRPYWDDGFAEPGRGGDSPDSIQYRARRLLVEMIKAEQMGADRYFTTKVWYDRTAVTVEKINAELSRKGMGWRVAILDHEYVMTDL